MKREEIITSVTDLLQKAQFVVDASGNKKAVLLDYTAWEELLSLLEDLEDAEEVRTLREAGEEAIPWEQAKSDSARFRPFGLCTGEFTVPGDFDAPLPGHIIEEFEGK